eukprot:bmy_18097T0
MERENSTVVTEFILAGLTQSQNIQLLVFVLVLIFYLIILPGNFLIIFTIRSDPGLTAPLYFFLGNLAFLDASYSFIVAPRMLVDFLSEKKVISYRGCITQLFFLHFLGGGEGLLLVVMAFDRYIAICRPLHYSTVMNPRTCYALLLALWLGGFVHSIIQVIKLACTDTFVVEILMIYNSGLMTLLCFLGLLASYAVTLCRERGPSFEGKSKAVSTCTTHIIVIFLMFGPGIFIYTCPFRAFPADKVVGFSLSHCNLSFVERCDLYPSQPGSKSFGENSRVCRSVEGVNYSRVSEFVLLGLTDSPELQIFFFVMFSFFYLMTMLGNCLILLTVLPTPHLHSPMYFLLRNLSLIDMCLSSFTTPKMIMDFLAQHKTISFEGCISQIFFLHLFTGTEIVLLISMSFDRYIAICKPLHYSSIMSQRVFVGLVVTSWMVGFLHTVSQLAFTLYLPFYGPNVIDSFFCDLPLVIQLACIDIYVLGIFMISTRGVIALISFLLLLTSYIIVLVTVKDLSSTGSSKAFSTCTAHFIVV